MNGHHELRNRYLHVDWARETKGTTFGADQVTDQVKALLNILGDTELSALEIMARLGLSHRPTFRQNYLNPTLEAGLVERTIPDKPTSRLQKVQEGKMSDLASSTSYRVIVDSTPFR